MKITNWDTGGNSVMESSKKSGMKSGTDSSTDGGNVTTAVMLSATLTRCDNNIRFVLSHPGINPALKAFIQDGLERPAADVLNDLQILDFTLRRRCHLLIENEVAALPLINAEPDAVNESAHDTGDCSRDRAAPQIQSA